ncbi:MAG: thioredoxin domain-containing protein [Thermoanaerobaculaceae bacterium]|nr:thioredoxin domain-containing protein [Thermoanaerobaculaceae bacterium]MDI9620271.1 thioredoxin domain-containing protein [Acidobacteriota bacterium]NLH11223.1 thioredoxin domain-containing protein [Holophagae bacterium]HPW56468.1 thioredoxin domain-containing protein [Thermoanaerobaculaceae bacterium]
MPNRLVDESSPYLRQHANNPVAWFPWGEEALALARAEDKPIFLSIGYAACHWCHVMERESFEDTEAASILNRDFVPVKVDREERPDIDAVYMAAVQAMTGVGGWPLSVFLTPAGEPFFGGTYFPPEPRWGRPSFKEVLTAIARAWRERRAEVVDGAATLLAALRQREAGRVREALDLSGARVAFIRRLDATFDPVWGGFDSAPKFPTPSRLFLLLDLADRDQAARRLLSVTLDGMAAGGMYDWLGGGFHRYSVDRHWLVPHFEKMLYDNALLARLYGQAGLRLGNPRWVEVARATAEWMLAVMQGPEGGFFSSTDADTPDGEGFYFTWTVEEVRSALSRTQADLVIALCDLDGQPSFEHGRSLLRPSRPVADAGAAAGLAPEVVDSELAAARRTLLAVRRQRLAPATDDKRLAGWNGMAVWALAWLGAALPEARFLAAAQRAARFLRDRTDACGRLERAWRDGVASGTETLEDVAWVAAGWLQFGEVTGHLAWIEAADALVRRRLPHYLAEHTFDTPDDGPALIMRPHNPLDNAIPSAGAVLALVLARLAAITGNDEFAQSAHRIVTGDAALAQQVPEAFTTLLQAAAAVEGPLRTVVVSGDPARGSTSALLATALRQGGSETTVLLGPATPLPAEMACRFPVLGGRRAAPDGAPLAWLCEGGVCRPPLRSSGELVAAMSGAAFPDILVS